MGIYKIHLNKTDRQPQRSPTDLKACSIRAELTVRKESVLGIYLSGPGIRKSGRKVEKAGESWLKNDSCPSIDCTQM